jgi:hypothetical protein
MVESHPIQTPSSTSFEKELEIRSHTQSSESLDRRHDMDKEEKGEEAEVDEKDPHGDGYGGKENALETGVTRISTKSSWKDPGPPPDGGWKGWIQGM